MLRNFYLLLFIFLISCRPNGNFISVKGSELYYTPAVSAREVEKAAQFFTETDFLSHSPMSMQLDKVGNTPVFRLVIKKEVAALPQTRETAIAFGRIVQKDLFNGQAFILHLCDKRFTTLKAFSFKTAATPS